MIGVELPCTHIETYQSVVCTNPNAFIMILRKSSHEVVRQDTWRIGVAAEVTEGIAIIAQQPLFGANPHHAVTIEQ